jgi:glucose-1-phosphate thymidylyltransferase
VVVLDFELRISDLCQLKMVALPRLTQGWVPGKFARCKRVRLNYSPGRMKGIILAGGAGSRLFPLTLVASKQLQPVYDKPMVYYPLTTLIEGGVRELCLISTPQDLPRFSQLLGNGSAWGLSIEYREQAKPEGIAQAFLIAESFIGKEAVALILGDNVFYGGDGFYRAIADFKEGATIFGYHVNDPERYGVVEFDSDGHAISIEEKPKQAKSNYAVPGLYLYDNNVVTITRHLRPSARGELEITDVNVEYLRRKQLHVHRLSRGFAWLDAGTSSSLHEASAYVQTIEKRAGIKIGCPEEAAFRRGFLSLERLEALTAKMPKCEYREYLAEVIAEAKRLATLAP